ncbi:type III secretion system export apparatus subunit SctT [Rouxiella badensis]|jgi:type III secretion protein T|uniref:EscT/YscT/HrcT family type III secretion system export apparatus protein n=1 Tax=Rouxiella badensis TaxID=1646377 RepID=A0A1X0WI45_9GAMM|nr:type III secretion system export apparatus subunit SctT [Rouxiella badensis]MCC3703320.1 type III secretion system export apparatus subunit SctT [Rouxiella badensis]MCC3731743.1 type III secretion system export apparatus subunit SctT [Rouxiella badensis]MCC3738678.1 type III secretion system export apparatus subunit SctT [Rouxiella badensis]MCC3746755.1 type III secretion system export apparatus subunit SctT [Rouxiella badensis]MCC3757132.1 type III secretion system export apparatus subunit
MANMWTHWMPIVGMCMLRPLGVFLLMPLFSSANLGGALNRSALLLVIALPMLPVYSDWQSPTSAMGYVMLAVGELCIGLIIGFCAAIPFWALDMAGFLIDTMRGSSMASVLNPMLGQQSSLFGIFFTQLFSVLFLMSGSFNELIDAIYQSYVTLPPGGTLSFGPDGLAFIGRQWRLMYELCLRFSMPAIVVIMLVDMAMGLINRSAQQLNVFFLAMPIKSAFALLMLVISCNFAFGDLRTYSMHFSEVSETMLSIFR